MDVNSSRNEDVSHMTNAETGWNEE